MLCTFNSSAQIAAVIATFVTTLTPFLVQHQAMHTISVKLLLTLVGYALGDLDIPTEGLAIDNLVGTLLILPSH